MRPRAIWLFVVAVALLNDGAHAWPKWLRFPRRNKNKRIITKVLDDVKRGEFYGALGVRAGASPQQLKKAYREMAKTVHPDKNEDTRAASAFDALRDAYDVLAEPMARRQYDAQRTYRLQQEKANRSERREDQQEAVGGVVGQIWRRVRGVARTPARARETALAPAGIRPTRSSPGSSSRPSSRDGARARAGPP